MAWPVTDDIKCPPHFPLASDKARYSGDPRRRRGRRDARAGEGRRRAVEVDYEPLPSIADVEKALEDGAPIVHEDLGTNECYVWKLETDDAQAAFAAADVVVTRRYLQPRLIPNAMEPRGVLAQSGRPASDAVVRDADPAHPAVTPCTRAGIPESKIRVIAPDVGGGFGSKLAVYPEGRSRSRFARRLGRPVKWTEERAEDYVATIHGRDIVHQLEFAATRDGMITAVQSEAFCAMGAYSQLITPGIPMLGAWLYAGCYDDPELRLRVHERVHAHDADRRLPRRRPARGDLRHRARRWTRSRAELGMDPVELRRKNFIKGVPAHDGLRPHDRLGRLRGHARQAARGLDLDAFRADQPERRASGSTKLLGVGFSTWIEMCGLAPSGMLAALRYALGGWDAATIGFMPRARSGS